MEEIKETSIESVFVAREYVRKEKELDAVIALEEYQKNARPDEIFSINETKLKLRGILENLKAGLDVLVSVQHQWEDIDKRTTTDKAFLTEKDFSVISDVMKDITDFVDKARKHIE